MASYIGTLLTETIILALELLGIGCQAAFSVLLLE